MWLIHRHATVAALFGIAVVGVWLLCRRRGATERTLEPLTVLGILLAAQGLVGSVQYELHLPSDMVWVHVALATVTWVTVLWAVAAAGRLVPRVAPLPADEPPAEARPLESVGRAAERLTDASQPSATLRGCTALRSLQRHGDSANDAGPSRHPSQRRGLAEHPGCGRRV